MTTSCTSTAGSTRCADIETINTELILADLQTLEKAIPRLEKEARNAKDRKPVLEAARPPKRCWTQGSTAVLGPGQAGSAGAARNSRC